MSVLDRALALLHTGDRAPNEQPPAHLSLALQGGGSYGAFTWGVIDRLLEEPALRFDVVSGASAGAVNAVLLAAGLMDGGRASARAKLEAFWRRVSDAGAFMRHSSMSGGGGFGLLAGALSPYQFNPFNLDPLRAALEAEINFEGLARRSPLRLMIAATRVSDGQPRLFDERAITADVVLASACLPLLRQAVTIEGEAFWDGGYAANPPLLALAHEARARDVLVVQLTPTRAREVPRTRDEIRRRLEQINLNATLNVELEALRLGAEIGATRKLRRLRVHRVALEDSHDLGDRGPGDLQWSFLTGLRDSGRRAAETWLRAGLAVAA